MKSASLEERDRRWTNIRKEIERCGLDGLLVITNGQLERRGSMRYVADTNAKLLYGYVVFPLKGDPIAIFGSSSRGGWIKDKRTVLPMRGGWVTESEPYAPVVAEAIKELNIENGCIGIEGDFMSLPVYQRLVKELPQVTFKPANIIHELKMVKSPEEISLVENGVDMVVAVGGGSVIDSAKIIAVAISERCHGWDIMKGLRDPER